MAFFGSSWNDDDDYDGPLWGNGLERHNERKKIRARLQEELDMDEVPEHLIDEELDKE